MTNKTYVKVLLYAYPKMEDLASAISAGAEVKAALSFRAPGDTFSVAESVANEILRASFLRKTYAELGEIFSRCTNEELYLLEYKYFRRKKVLRERFAECPVNCSERSYYRKQAMLLNKIAAALIMRGMTEQWFFERFSEFPSFVRVYRVIAEGKEKSVVSRRRKSGLTRAQKSECSSCAEEAGLFLPCSTNRATATAETQSAQIKKICKPESPSFFSSEGGSGSSVGAETAAR